MDIVPKITPGYLKPGAANKHTNAEESAKADTGARTTANKKAPINTNHQGNQPPSVQAPTSWGNNGSNNSGWSNSR